MKLTLLRRRDLSCQELVELVTEYLEGAMSARRRQVVEAHLAMCEHCHAYLEQMRTTIALTGRLRVDDVEPGAMEELLEVFRDWKR